MPLEVVIVGAGIAGLCAAISLGQAGHSIYEKSRFATEVGAALNLNPNGAAVLSSLGFSFDRALVRRQERLESVSGETLQRLGIVDLSNAEQDYGYPLQSVLRADLHRGLRELATEGSHPASLRLGCAVARIDAAQGIVELETGTNHRADLIIAADGTRSIGRTEVKDYPLPAETGMHAFRFLIPTKDIKDMQSIKQLIPGTSPGVTIFVDTREKEYERHLVWYDCHGGDIQNFVGIYPSCQGKGRADSKALLLEQFGHFHPKVIELLNLAGDVRCWPLFSQTPADHWSKDKLLLIGDAAHTMLPFGGQGGNSAIEDGGVLGLVFENATAADVAQRLRDFEQLRVKRIAVAQILSSARFGTELAVQDQLKPYVGFDDREMPRSLHERLAFEWRYNVRAEYARMKSSGAAVRGGERSDLMGPLPSTRLC